ncbi:MAG TPA: hypothetical protein PLC52_00500 [Anaerolineales bacterium]|nr:hypothetical protein [Anaerolineales bacterium]HRQ91333.1 hypothetical protein [Anaerolineales bacterium]
MYQNIHSFAEHRAQDASQLARLQAQAHAVDPQPQVAVLNSLFDEMRNQAAGALFSLGSWVAPRKSLRPTVPVQLQRTANHSIAG